MRRQYYDVIFCDIDDTLIYGFWTDLMRITWNIFRSNTLSDLLMWLQYKFNLYRVNTKLVQFIKNQHSSNTYISRVIFITVRKPSVSTRKMLQNIFRRYKLPNYFTVHELASDNAALDKTAETLDILSHLDEVEDKCNCCFIDDNKDVRKSIERNLEIDTFDPIAMREGLIG